MTIWFCVLAIAALSSLDRFPHSSPSTFEARECARLRAHFDRVLARLDARDVSKLSAAQRRARLQAIQALGAYSRAGRFPRNRGESARATPIFVDQEGRRCAMAYLIETSGGAGLVARIAATTNLARIHDLSGDSDLGRWLAEAGLTLDEAADIQPQYGPDPSDREQDVPSEAVMTGATMAAVTLGSAAVLLNLQVERPWETRKQSGLFGLVTAAGLLAPGLTDVIQDGSMRGSGYVSTFLGGMSAILSIRNLATGPGNHVTGSLAPMTTDRAALCAMLRRGESGEPQLGVHLKF
jgi:hypothetical protein